MAVDAWVYEFMGLAMLALCIGALAVPPGDGRSGPSPTADHPVFGAKFAIGRVS
jgi:hypothetical protein